MHARFFSEQRVPNLARPLQLNPPTSRQRAKLLEVARKA